MRTTILTTTTFLLLSLIGNAQNVSINSTGAAAHPSAMLEVSSPNKGLLIPRLTTAMRTGMSNPAQSLLVYDIDSSSFWYYNSGWIELNSEQIQSLSLSGDILEISQGNAISLSPFLDNTDSQTLTLSGEDLSISGGNTITLPLNTQTHQIADDDGDTRVSVENTTDEDEVSIFLAGSEKVRFHNNGVEFNTGTNLGIGNNAGLNMVNGSANLNLFVGNEAGSSFTQGFFNTVLGQFAGRNLEGASSNVIIGAEAGTNLIDGSSNVIIGDYGGNSLSTGSNNTLIGTIAGGNLSVGSGNVFIGNGAGSSETGDNKLYIDNQNTSNPLIYGEFDNDLLTIYGELRIEDAYSLPQVDGTGGQVITTDGNGSLSWSSLPGVGSSLFSVSSNLVSYTGDLDNDDFVFGSTSLEDDGSNSHDSRFYFDKSKSAFRAGIAGTDQWDDVNVGTRSFAAGLNTIASGGTSTAFGAYSQASGSSSFAMGFDTRSEAANCTALGRYNIGGGNPSFLVDEDPIFEVGVGSTSTRSNALTVLKSGKVIIGEHTSYNVGGDFELVVDGGLLCESIKVQDSGNWPDYVFEEDYELRSLDELRGFIAEKKHLPGVPSAEEMNGNGVQLGEITEVLLEKVEELTLYVLQLQAEIDNLKSH